MNAIRWPKGGDGSKSVGFSAEDVVQLQPLVVKLLQLVGVSSLLSKNQGVFQHTFTKSRTNVLTPGRRSAIKRDLHRTLIGPIFCCKLPKSAGFSHASLGELLLKTLLESFAVFNPRLLVLFVASSPPVFQRYSFMIFFSIGYCQGLNFVAGALLASFPFSPSAWKSVSDMTAEAEKQTTASALTRSSGDSAGKSEAEIRKNDALCLETCFWLMVGIVSRFQSMFQKKIPGFDRFSKNVHLLAKILFRFHSMFIYSPKIYLVFIPIVPCRCRRVFKKALPTVSSECHAKLCELLPESPHSFIGQFFLSLFVVPPPSSLSVPSSPSSLPTRDVQLTSTVPLALSIWINVFEVNRTFERSSTCSCKI